jgi:hypothetical protein
LSYGSIYSLVRCEKHQFSLGPSEEGMGIWDGIPEGDPEWVVRGKLVCPRCGKGMVLVRPTLCLTEAGRVLTLMLGNPEKIWMN